MADQNQLKDVLIQTLNPDAAVRNKAEATLDEAQKNPGYPLLVLGLLAEPSIAEASQVALRQAASIHFKNLIKKRWAPSEDEDNVTAIAPADRDVVKAHLVDLMCRVPPDVQRQCSEAVAIIAAEDFPAKWNNLLPELVSRFGSEDMNIVVGCLTTASSILKRFRYVERNDALYADLKYVLDHLQKPLLVLFKQISATVRSAGASAAGQSDLPLRVEALRIMCRIFYSLNWQDLPEFFEDHMNEWMEEFAAYLQYENPALVDDDEETRPGPIDKLQEAIVGNLSLYASKDEEPFLPFLPKFTGFVWKLLMQVTPLPKHDGLMAVLIKFLSGLVGKQMHRALFQDYSSLQQIVTHIVVPNIKVREVDVECFEDDPADFILADMVGSESDSRRRCCCDLLRSMTRQFQKETTELCMQHVHTMLAEFSSDPINKWEQKDAVIHLVLAVSVLAQSADFGVSQVNEGVDVMDFFTKHILPELQSTEHDVRPLVKADSIKFVHTFRNQFSVEQLSALMPLLIAHLGSPSIVVHTYAAACIEKILTTRENINAKTFKFGKAQFQPFLEPMFTALFRIVDSPDPENEYVMKAVMRSLSVAREDIIPVTQMMIGKLTEALGRVCKNPSNPHYNHYLFESIAVLIRSVCVNDPRFTTAFEELLFPPFQTVLQMDVAEFTPYVFQILAQLLEFRTDGMSTFETLFPPLLQPVLWERTGNVPALARLIQAYLKKGASTLIKQGHLMPILGVFQKLISSKKNEVHAFSLLGTLITVVEKENIMPHFGTLFQILLMRLQQGKSSRFAHLITIFFGTFVAKFGATLFLEQTNAIQPGLGIMLLSNVWLPNLKEGSFTPIESKAQVLALTQLLCNTPVLFTDANGEKVWEAAIFMSLKVLNSNALQGRASAASDEDDLVEISYDAAFSRLRFAALVVDDPFVGIKNPGANLAQELNRLCASKPGQFLPVIQRAVQGDEKVTATLQLILGNAGVTLV